MCSYFSNFRIINAIFRPPKKLDLEQWPRPLFEVCQLYIVKLLSLGHNAGRKNTRVGPATSAKRQDEHVVRQLPDEGRLHCNLLI